MPARLRPPADTDAEAVLAVIVARDVADLGVPDFTLEDLQADWASPGLELVHDARVAGRDGTVRGYAVLLGDDAVVIVHPEAEGEGTGTVLRRWAEARAAERGTSVLRQFAYGANDGARAHLREAGYVPAQHYFRLRADLDAVPPAPAVPLRTFDVGARRGGRPRAGPGRVRRHRRPRVPAGRVMASEVDREGRPRPVAVAAARRRGRARRRRPGRALGGRHRLRRRAGRRPPGTRAAGTAARCCSACSTHSAVRALRTPS